MINLLPWRTTLRIKQRQDFFKFLLGTVCLTSMLLIFYYMHLTRELKIASSKQQLLEQQKNQLAKEFNNYQKQQQQLASTLANVLLLKQNQLTQINLIYFLQALPFLLPENLHLTQLSLTNQKLTISGIANKYQDITQLLKNLELNQQVKQVKLLKNPPSVSTKDISFKISLILSGESNLKN